MNSIICKSSEQILKEKIIKDMGIKGNGNKLGYRATKSKSCQINPVSNFDNSFSRERKCGISHLAKLQEALGIVQYGKLLMTLEKMENFELMSELGKRVIDKG